MKTKCFALLKLALLFRAVSSEGVNKPHNAVQVLTDKNFDDALSDEANGLWLLKFYAPWCGHCKKLAPILDKVAPFMEGKMAIGSIDCTTEQTICQRFEVRGYPTLKIYRDGEFFDFAGERTADSIINFGEKMAADAVVAVSSHKSALDDMAGKGGSVGVAFVAYDPTAEGDTVDQLLQSTTLLQVFKQVARKQQAFATFSFITPDTTAEEIEKFGAGDKAFIAKIEEDVDPKIFQEEEMNSPALLEFVKANNHALVTALGSHNFRSIGTLGKRMVIGVINPDDNVKTEAFLADMKKIAVDAAQNDLSSQFNFCSMDGKKWERFLQQFDISTANLPDMFVLDFDKRQFWHNSTMLGVQELLDGVISGEIIAQKQERKGANYILTLLSDYMPVVVLIIMIVIFAIAYFVLQDDVFAEESDVPEESEARESDTAKDEPNSNAEGKKNI